MLAIKNALIVVNNEENEIIHDGAIIVDGDRITRVGKTQDLKEEVAKADTVIDGKDKILIPGLINAHTHVMGHMFKGFTEDGTFEYFYGLCFPMEDYLNEESAYWLSKVGCMETLKNGVVMINDIFHYSQQTAQAVSDLGMRAVIEHKVYDVKALGNLYNNDYSRDTDAGMRKLEENEELIKKWHGKDNGRIQCWVGNHATDTNTIELLKAGRALADQYGVGLHIHVAQSFKEFEYTKSAYGKTPIELLCDIGYLRDDVVCAHLTEATEHDIKLFEESGANFAHCPVILGKFGIFPRIKDLINSKIPMAIASDWLTLNPWSDMRAAIGLTRTVASDASLQYAQRAFKMMTTDAAKVLKVDKDLGSLEVGKKADILVIDGNRPNLVPMRDVVASLVYNMTGSEVEKVIIDGNIVVDDSHIITADESEACRNAQKFAGDIWEKGRLIMESKNA